MFNRTSGAQLPSAEELMAILGAESPRRAVHGDFVSNHLHVFGPYRELCEAAGAELDWLDMYPDMSLDNLLRQISRNQTTLKKFISQHTESHVLYEDIYSSLILPDDTSKSEAIFVFGAGSNARIERAVELYHQGVSDRIIISGHRPFYGTEMVTEAARMAKYARAAGVSPDALLLEEKSITLPDNVKKTLDMFASMDWMPQSITYVVTNYAMLRADMEWYKFTPWSLQMKAVAARQQSPLFSPKACYTDDHVTSLVLNEYAKIIIESKMDLLNR